MPVCCMGTGAAVVVLFECRALHRRPAKDCATNTACMSGGAALGLQMAGEMATPGLASGQGPAQQVAAAVQRFVPMGAWQPHLPSVGSGVHGIVTPLHPHTPQAQHTAATHVVCWPATTGCRALEAITSTDGVVCQAPARSCLRRARSRPGTWSVCKSVSQAGTHRTLPGSRRTDATPQGACWAGTGHPLAIAISPF